VTDKWQRRAPARLSSWSKAWLPLLLLTTSIVSADQRLTDLAGRAESRVYSAAYPLVAGRSVSQIALLERLERLGYRRTASRPTAAGEFFYGHDRFWIYRPLHRLDGRNHKPLLFALELERGSGRILSGMDAEGRSFPLTRPGRLWLEPELLAESLNGDRARRRKVAFARLPEHMWQAVLAAEDARFFDHRGLDARGIARAALANIKKGGVAQGGSTITQQLIKNRDLTPKRTLGRKASEAVRALTLEAQYSKEEILEAYLDQLYLGHLDGLALHGIGSAARAYFSVNAEGLSLTQAATLAAMIQGPNRLSPLRHAERLRERRDWVLARMRDEGWIDERAMKAAQASAIDVRPNSPSREVSRPWLSSVHAEIEARVSGRLEHKRGVRVESALDPWLQSLAESVVEEQLERIGGGRRRSQPLAAALVALDIESGDVLAYASRGPEERRHFDYVAASRRQPGSTIKPLLLLEAFESCGARDPLHPATRVADEPLNIDIDGRVWKPENYDGEYRGVIDLRSALADSRNVPFVRLARWCGFDASAKRLRKSGLQIPDPPPPSFSLGAIETSPLQLAEAYTVLATPGKKRRARIIRRLDKPAGGALASVPVKSKRVVHASSAYLVRSLMIDAVEQGTARIAEIDAVEVAAKTGTTSDGRDGWMAGQAGGLVTVVWVGLDGKGAAALTGGATAGPIWRSFMKRAVAARPGRELPQPQSVVERHIDPKSGLLVRPFNPRARPELFRKSSLPRRNRFWREDESPPIVR